MAKRYNNEISSHLKSVAVESRKKLAEGFGFGPSSRFTCGEKSERSQTITEFFKPVLKQDLDHEDRTALCRGNVKDAGIGLSVLHAECFEKKISSPKKVRRKKMPDQTLNTSPVVDAFWRGIKKEGRVNILEKGRACEARGLLNPKVVIQKLFTTAGSRSCFLAEKDNTVQSEQGRNEKCLGVTRAPLPRGNSWEQKTVSMDLDDTSSGSDKWISLPEADTRKACARNNGTVNNTSLCQNPGLPTKLPCTPAGAEFRLSLETLCRERKRKKHKMKQSEPHPVKPFSGTSVSHQGYDVISITETWWGSMEMDGYKLFRKDRQGRRGEDVVLQVSDQLQSMKLRLGMSEELTKSLQIMVKVNTGAEPTRKGAILDLVLTSKEGLMGNVKLKGSLGCSGHEMVEFKIVRAASRAHSKLVSLDFRTADFGLFRDLLEPTRKGAILDLVLTSKEGLMGNVKLKGSLGCSGHEMVEFKIVRAASRAHSKLVSLDFRTADFGLFRDLLDDTSQPKPKKVSKHEASSPNALRTSSEMAAEGCMSSSHESSQLSWELKIESTCTGKLNGKSESSFDSEDESLKCSLDDDDDDEEEVFMSLQEILSSSPKPQAGTQKDSCLDSFSRDTLSKPPVVSQVSYVNSLEHLLKEKEESKRVDELEKLLEEHIQRRETDSSDRDDEENASGDEDLSEEHRAFLKRFSVVAYAIPDYHPGEDIFDLSTSGKIFNQHNLDLRNFHFSSENLTEKLLLSSGVTQQLSLAVNGFLSSAYGCILCPIPVLKWLFQMMSVHPDCCVSAQILDRLMEITLKTASISDEQSKPWIPSLADVSAVFVNMGVAFRSLFPLQHLQPNFNEHDILSQMQETLSKQQPGDLTSASPAFSSLPESNLINVIKFLGFCTTVIQGGYTDEEILLLLLLLFKISLEKQLKQIPLIDFQCLFIKLLISIKDWDTKMPELCLAVSELSSHHHNLLWLVQLVPSWIIRGREVKRRLSLVIISKLLNKKYTGIPNDSDKQMSLLHQYLVYMKPSNLLKRMREREQQNTEEDHLYAELEQETYYLIYILLHLVSEASFFDVVNSNQRQHLLKLCGALDRHIKCDIREDARLFYRTKVKDLVARIYGKWQDTIQTTRPIQGKLHDFWEPDS
ncbi:PREDICTED: protein FAM178A-like [Mesitornis unicolor]|uniref:protein FAM178A-like n=1 Tax=Mesitornis unicolor TaxID=54374 RepID=UPI0005282342|nr:PREDICTED: protein FAM178A-like [Mesitornis unicolor]